MEKDEHTINPKPLENVSISDPLKNNWDKCLYEYNNYSKEYIKHYKKALNGNFFSMLRYPNMKAKSEDLLQQLIDAQTNSLLTKKQIKELQKLKNKRQISILP